MNIEYHLAESFIILGFSFIVLIILGTFFLKIVYFQINKIKNKKIIKIKLSLTHIVRSQQIFPTKHFLRKWKRLDILLQIINDLDKTSTGKYWDETRSKVIMNIMIPLARKSTYNFRWKVRYFAVRTFCLMPAEGNDEYLVKLVNDPIPLVNIYAAQAALLNFSEPAIDSVLARIASESWEQQAIYLRVFDYKEKEKEDYFENKLKSSKDPIIRAACYEIMLKYPPKPIHWDIAPDVISDNVKLKIGSIKYIAYVDREKAIPLLIKLLKDPIWKVRLISIHRLGMLKADDVIPQITACIDDIDLWVKMSAMHALKNMGEKGKQALLTKGIVADKISSILTHHINTWW